MNFPAAGKNARRLFQSYIAESKRFPYGGRDGKMNFSKVRKKLRRSIVHCGTK